MAISRKTALLSQIADAERSLEAELRSVLQKVDIETHGIRESVKDSIEQTPEQIAALERIEHLQLRLELLRNTRMNWRTFESSLKKKGMSMRINQDAHLKHLIHFLETGKGTITGDEPDLNAQEQLDRDLMTFEVQPTGAGKTGAFAIDIALMDVSSLTLVPFDSLLDQTKKDLMKIGGINESDIGIVGGGTKEIGRMHTIATYSGHAAMMKRGGEYANFMRTKCKLVICDEVHHQALGDQTQSSIVDVDNDMSEEDSAAIQSEHYVMSHLSEQTSVKSLKIGFTATPRGSRKHVQKYFPHCLGRVFHREMVDAGLVVPYKIVQCDGSVYAGELEKYLTEDEEAKILEREQIYRKLAGEYTDVLRTYGNTKRRSKKYPMHGMVFCTNHAECEKFAEEAAAHGLRCKIVTGHEAKGRTGQQVIDAAVQQVLNGECDLLVTVEKLATGFNCPEINAVIWARITSAAKTIQGIGRGARSFTDEFGRVKTDCTVFETDWQLKKNGKKKNGRKPMRLADALAFNGEDPEAICEMADGSNLNVNRMFVLDESGVVEVDGDLAVGIEAYASSCGEAITGVTIKKYIKSVGLLPLNNCKAMSKNRPVDLYWKGDIDRLLPRRLDNNGEVAIGGRIAINLKRYAEKHDIGSKLLQSTILRTELAPVPNVNVLQGNVEVVVYWKDEVENCMPKFLSSSGQVEINERIAVGLTAYAASLVPKMSEQTLMKIVLKAQIVPVAGHTIYSGRHKIDAYWKDEIDQVLPRQLDNSGLIEISGRYAVGLHAYAQTLGIAPATLKKYVEIGELEPVSLPHEFSGVSDNFRVYWKDAVDALLPATLDDDGTVEIEGRRSISVRQYALSGKCPVGYQALKRRIISAGLQPIPDTNVLSGNAPVTLFWKDEVDALL